MREIVYYFRFEQGKCVIEVVSSGHKLSLFFFSFLFKVRVGFVWPVLKWKSI